MMVSDTIKGTAIIGGKTTHPEERSLRRRIPNILGDPSGKKRPQDDTSPPYAF